jgi:hypothetical protein
VIEVGRVPHCLDHLVSLTALFGGGRIDLELDPGLAGQQLQRLVEVKALGVLDESDDIPALATSEAVIEPSGGIERQRRRLLLVKWANGHVSPALTLDCCNRGDEIDEVGSCPYPIDVIPPVHRPRLPGRDDASVG